VAHIPVMPERVAELLRPALLRDNPVLLDATVGLGGHAAFLLEEFPSLHLIGLDRDPQAIDAATDRLGVFADRVTLVHAIYDEIPTVLADLGVDGLDAVLFDLGVSSMQLDREERGFAYSVDAPLDMRMDPSAGLTAADVLNTYDTASLTRILREFGEERFASRIARRIVQQRDGQPFVTSAQLVDVVRSCIPAPARRTGGNPAKRTFQALRIEVNGEIDALRNALPAALNALNLNGRIVVMSYQSLEDRIVKRALLAGAKPDVPVDLPIVPPDALPWLRLLTRGAERASEAEVARNPRAASVRLRAAERIAA